MLIKIVRRIPLLVAIGYGLLLAFALVGAMMGRGYLPTLVLVLTCLAWTAARILNEAVTALKILRSTWSAEDEQAGSDDADAS